MSIEFANVFPVLAQALPEFMPNQDDLDDRLSYPFLNDMVRFVCDRAYPEFETVTLGFAALMERLISEGDQRVLDLALDALDTLGGREERDFVAGYFGPATQAIWERICSGELGR